MKKLILLFIGSIILFSLWKCVFFPSKDSTSSSENFPIPSSSSDTTSKEPNESDAVLKSSNFMRESLSSSSSTSDEPFSTDESNDAAYTHRPVLVHCIRIGEYSGKRRKDGSIDSSITKKRY